MAGAQNPHDHDPHHGHDHPHEGLEPEPGPVDPARWTRWRISVVLGALIGLASWIGWPLAQVLTQARPLRRISASPSLLGFTLSIGLATWLLTVTPEPRPASAHRAGQVALRVGASLGAGLGLASFLLGRGSLFVELVAFPLTLAMLLIGFAYLGRLTRLAGGARLANLADLAGIVLPLFWIAGQTLEPGLPVQAAGGLGLGLGGAVWIGVIIRFLAMKRPA